MNILIVFHLDSVVRLSVLQLPRTEMQGLLLSTRWSSGLKNKLWLGSICANFLHKS